MKAYFLRHFTFIIILTLSSSPIHAQLSALCKYFEAPTTLAVSSDLIFYTRDSSKKFILPIGWDGTVDFEDLGDIHIKKSFGDSAYMMLSANEVWLVEFHEEFIQRMNDSSVENCSFLWDGYSFSVYQLPNKPIHVVYQIARENKKVDGWTWIFRIYTNAEFTTEMLSDLQYIITQIVEIYDPDNH